MGLKRTPLKKGNSQLKKGGKIKSKPKTEEQKKEREELFKKDKAFYTEIWDEMELPRRCFETGKLLPSEPLLTMFHHCLYKQSYPQFRHCKWNIVVILPDVHALTHSNIDKTPKIKEYTERIKNEYLYPF